MDYDRLIDIWLCGQKAYVDRKDFIYVRASERPVGDKSSKATKSPEPMAVLVRTAPLKGEFGTIVGGEEAVQTEVTLRRFLEGTLPLVDVGSGRWVPADSIDEFVAERKIKRTDRELACDDWHPYARRSWIKLINGMWMPSTKTLKELEAEMAAAYERALAARPKTGDPSTASGLDMS